ncbi:MAG: sulfate permease [Desulfobacterales bacterium]|nr:sulfate permease [Desulfobacterales bacterium]
MLFKHDLTAGLTVAVVLIPQSMAYAMLAGLPPVYGLYAATVAPAIGALWGSLRQLGSGPIAIMSLLVLTTLTSMAEPGSSEFIELSFLLAFMVGVIYLVVGLFRMGIIMSFISHAAVKGFTSAAALIIISTQLPHLFGVRVGHQEYVISKFAAIAGTLGELHWITLGVGLLALGIIHGVKRINPNFPGAMLALVITSVVVILLDLHSSGVAVIGRIQGGLPRPMLPPFDVQTLSRLTGPAVVIALVSFAETYSVGRSIAAETKQKLNVNQEFIGQGMANLLGSFFQCYPTSGSFSRSAINFSSGAKTGIASVITSLSVVVALLFLTPMLTYIPKAALAALVISAVWTLFHPKEVFRLWKMNRHDGIVAICVFLLSLIAKPDYALLLGVIMSLMFFLWKTMHPRVVRISKSPTMGMFTNADAADIPSCPQILQLRSDNSIFFANAEYTVEHIMERFDKQEQPPKYLLLDLQSMTFIDITGVDELRELKETLQDRGTELALMEIHIPVRQVFDSSGFTGEMDTSLVFHKRGDAYENLFARLDHDYCRDICPYALFQECHSIKDCDDRRAVICRDEGLTGDV